MNQADAVPPLVHATVVKLVEIEAGLNAVLKPELELLLDERVLLVDGTARMQWRDDMWHPFFHDLIPFPDWDVDAQSLDLVLGHCDDGKTGFNLYGFTEDIESVHELAVETEIHVFTRATSAPLARLNSKQRNAIGNTAIPEGMTLHPCVDSSVYRLLPLMVSSWVYKHNVDDVGNLVQEICSWTYVAEAAKMNRAWLWMLKYEEQPVSLIGLVQHDEDTAVFQAFWQLPFDYGLNNGYDPKRPLGTLMLANALTTVSLQGFDTVLTWPSFTGPGEPMSYEAYKRKFSNERRAAYSYYGTHGKATPPYYDLTTKELRK